MIRSRKKKRCFALTYPGPALQSRCVAVFFLDGGPEVARGGGGLWHESINQSLMRMWGQPPKIELCGSPLLSCFKRFVEHKISRVMPGHHHRPSTTRMLQSMGKEIFGFVYCSRFLWYSKQPDVKANIQLCYFFIYVLCSEFAII